MAQMDLAGDYPKAASRRTFLQDTLVSLLPHPVATAFLLTILFALAALGSGTSFEAVLKGWGQGFIGLYPFVMENLLIMLFSFALGSTPIVRNTIGRLAGGLNSQGAAVIVIAALSIVLAFFNWGVGILGGVFLARETARRAGAQGLKFDFPLLLAAGLAGVVVWESGFSGIVPLYLAEGKHFLVKTTGQVGIGATILSPLNLGIVGALLIAVPLALYLARPATASPYKTGPTEEPAPAVGEQERSVAAYLERSRVLSLFFGGLALIYVLRFFASGKPLDTPNLLFTLLALGIFLHAKPMDYQREVIKGIRAIWFIALPLMFYSAIQGVLAASGLSDAMARWLTTVSAGALPAVTLAVSTVANFLVPSAGGQLMLGGPSAMAAAKALGVPFGKMALALAYGAGLAKLLQLYIFAAAVGLTDEETRLSSLAKYAGIVFVVAFVVCLIGLIVLPA